MSGIAEKVAAIVAATPEETAEDRAARYERALRAIKGSTLGGADFGDWVQAVCDDVLEGFEAECPACGTAVHEGSCVWDGEDEMEQARR